MSTDTIRVILADDHLVVRAGLKALLATNRDIEVVCEAANGREAPALVERLGLLVVVLDLAMHVLDGIATTREIAKSWPETKVLVLTMHTEDEYPVSLLEAGASGYLVKNAADRELGDAIRAVASGDSYVQPSFARALARQVSKRANHADERQLHAQLSERERDVLVLVAGGYSASEIGERLFISPKTVETYKQRINEKLGLSHRSDYVQFCLRLGLLKSA